MVDVSVRAQILELMLELKKEFDLTYLFITHDLAVLAQIATQAVVLERGRVVEAGSHDELLELGLLKPSDVKKQTKDSPAVKKYFMHGLGHPIGLDVHDVDVGFSSGAPLAVGSAFTIEPGIYRPGWGGVRIEDDVLLTREGPRVLTAFSRDLMVIG